MLNSSNYTKGPVIEGNILPYQWDFVLSFTSFLLRCVWVYVSFCSSCSELLSFLDFWCFYQIWKVLYLYFFKYFFFVPFYLHSWGTPIVHMFVLNGIPEVLFIFLCSFLSKSPIFKDFPSAWISTYCFKLGQFLSGDFQFYFLWTASPCRQNLRVAIPELEHL